MAGMRVPEAKSTARLNVLSAPQASADDFGAGVGRANAQLGNQLQNISEQGIDMAVQAAQAKSIQVQEDGYSAVTVGMEDWERDNVSNQLSRQTDIFLGDENYQKNVSTPLDEIFVKSTEGMGDKQRAGVGVMIAERRAAIERRVKNHTATQQKSAGQQAAGLARDSALGGYATQARTYTKKQPDGSVSIEFSELEAVLPDVISAQQVYNRRHGIEGDAAQMARVGAHEAAINRMVAVDEFDEADAYLDAVASSETYGTDLSAEQQKDARKEIKKARTGFEKGVQTGELVRYQNDFYQNNVPKDLTPKQLDEIYPDLAPSFKAQYAKSYKAKPISMSEQTITQAFNAVAAAPVDETEGILLARQLKSMGFSRETDKALYRSFDDKFNPKADAVGGGKFAKQKSVSEARIVDAFEKTNVRSGFLNYRARPFSERDGKISEFNQNLAQELDYYNTFVSDEMDRNKTWVEADAAYWKSDRMTTLQAEGNLPDFVESRYIVGEEVPAEADYLLDADENLPGTDGNRAARAFEVEMDDGTAAYINEFGVWP
jgi:hypothetical protein